jgi:predicted nucleic acid-binding protein
MKLLVEEPESDALTAEPQAPADPARERMLVAWWLLHTVLHCAANRHPDDVGLDSVAIVLDTVSLIELTRGDPLTAGTLPGQRRTNDAIHLAVALRIGADEMLSCDAELTRAVQLPAWPSLSLDSAGFGRPNPTTRGRERAYL